MNDMVKRIAEQLYVTRMKCDSSPLITQTEWREIAEACILIAQELETAMKKIETGRNCTTCKAERIVQAIERDFTDRRGLRQEWEQIDAEIQAEIRTTWTEIVRKELAKDE